MQRDPDRMVLFTDAVVAIAITLLVLPLVDVVHVSVAEHRPSIEVLTEHQPQIYSFLLSFVVIARLWMVHHSLFEDVKVYTRPMMLWNMLWLLTIVVLPFPTEMVGSYSNDRFTPLFYTGTIVASSICLTVLRVTIVGGVDRRSLSSASTTGLLVAAFILTALVPATSYFSLLLLLLAPLLSMVFNRGAQPEVAQ